jgi:hypothetical protein
MKQPIKRSASRRVEGMSWWLQVFLIVSFGISGVRPGSAQTANASLSGHITDSTGAIVPGAAVTLTESDTRVAAKTTSNNEGLYTFPSVKPGNYVMSVNASGFSTTTITGLTAGVQASLSRDVVLKLGAANQTVTVTDQAAEVAGTSSELGTQIGEHQIHDLPLNGRNFTELLTLTPGASPISTSQSNKVAVNDQGVLGVPSAQFSQPAIQGQINRENLYILDGVVNTDFTNGVYVIPPIIDDMREFQVQSHDDKAEYGSVLGGVVNVVTKSGTNNLHGSAWEFVRNNIFDARDSFADEYRSSPSPFRQNQFGATVGGPVWLPHLYNGHNRTFFQFGYEGWRYSQSNEILYNVPTTAELGGDFSHSLLAQNIYDPATTQGTLNGYTRAQFNYNGTPNVINPARLDQNMVKFLKTYDTGTPLIGNPKFNAYAANPHVDDSDHYMVRIDEQLGSKDTLFLRYDQLNVTDVSPNSLTQSISNSVAAKDLGTGWSHLLTSNILFDFRFGIATRPFLRGTPDINGISPAQGLGFSSSGGTFIGLGAPYAVPGISSGFGSQAPNTITNPVISYTPTLTWVHGVHNIKVGMQYIRQGNSSSSPPYGNYAFTNALTGDPNNVGTTGKRPARDRLSIRLDGTTITTTPMNLCIMFHTCSSMRPNPGLRRSGCAVF